MVAAQLSGEEAQQNLRTGNLLTSVYCRINVETNSKFFQIQFDTVDIQTCKPH